ncbi:Suppressor protein srp40 [Lasiodiplodia theobromae]|uniref:Suppressor protein srp40 n=1 Tax=Lasiodiplodia theobromae TaxID=45133 RepID=UPI0015C2FE11|nr:Suppressor protein srp40 [Lasiodiplodia theobromae]KAF4545070.1 Suppressor protein srp40 [Lasiodiplodia theobromae]
MSVTQALTRDSSASRKAPASSNSSAAPERTRLHITPFTPELLKAFIPPSVLPQASQISYHAVQTFPEKGFGYVELPTMEAQKLKKKLNGSILKGQKVRIEEARPEKRKKILEEIQSAAEAGMEEEDRKAGKKVKKIKRKDGVIPGYELPDERHVKRGWTEPETKKDYKRKERKDKDKKEKKNKSQPSKYTADKELLFKTKLPPNAVPTAKSDKALEKPKKSKKSSRDVVVHEFAKTTKHASFLKSSQVSKDVKTAAEFVEGKGWVDEDGNVVEQESESQRRRREVKAEAKRKRAEEKAAAAAAAAAAVAEKEAKKSRRKSALERAEALETKRKTAKASESTDESSDIEEDVSDDGSSVVSTSSSDVSSSSEEGSEESFPSEAESEVAQDEAEESSSESEPQVAHTKAADQDNIPRGSPGGDVEMTDSTGKSGDADEKEAKEVHPLEALFKRPKLPEGGTPTKLTPINTSFSFFGGGDDDEEAVEEANPPLTPYTRQDLQIRGMRSAAPTPDTAAIGKRFWRTAGDDEEEEEEDEEVEDSMMQVDANSVPIGSRGPEITSAPAQGTEEAEQSEFAKHFWEHRGDYNRAWKKRRREAMKVQRQRENRRLGRKVV